MGSWLCLASGFEFAGPHAERHECRPRAGCRLSASRSGGAYPLIACGSDLPARGKETYGKRPACQNLRRPLFSPPDKSGSSRPLRFKKAVGSGAPHALRPAGSPRVRRRCASHHGLAIARGSAPRGQQEEDHDRNRIRHQERQRQLQGPAQHRLHQGRYRHHSQPRQDRRHPSRFPRHDQGTSRSGQAGSAGARTAERTM